MPETLAWHSHDLFSYEEAITDWIASGRTAGRLRKSLNDISDLGVYEVGRAYQDMPGVPSGDDMTNDPGCKTMWMLSQTTDHKKSCSTQVICTTEFHICGYKICE